MKEVEGEVHKLHPTPVKLLGEEVVMTLLQIAKDLRSGKIPRQNFNMRHFDCGSAHCIAGWTATYLNTSWKTLFYHEATSGIMDESHLFPAIKDPILHNLFASNHPNDPIRAADAIERYVFNYDPLPWSKNLWDY